VADGRTNGANRSLRGGSWNNIARNVRAAYRNWNHPEDRNDNIGFRCAQAHGQDSVPPDQTIGRGHMRASMPHGAETKGRPVCW